MSSASSPAGARTAASPSASSAAPFSEAMALDPLGSGRFRAQLGTAWQVAGGKQHGGLMLALVTRAGLVGLDELDGVGWDGSSPTRDPLAVSAEYLRAPEAGPVELSTEVVKVGRTASVVRSCLRQDDRVMICATVTAGRLPDAAPEWTDLPELAAEPPPDSFGTTETTGRRPPPMASACEVRIDPATSAFRVGERSDPVVRGWVRPVGEPPDALFALLAGDILPPVLFNFGRPGWAPTVQLTALVRARPAPGWLRLQSSAMTIGGGWLDEDMIVVDSAGRLVCQARQLALYPLARESGTPAG